MTHLIECRDLRKHYGAIKSVDGVSLALERGEVLVVMGRSGSGKSSLLRTLALLEEPDAGQVFLNGREVFPAATLRRSEQRRLRQGFRNIFGFVFQSFALWPHRSVLGNVSEGLQVVKRLRRDQAEQIALETLQKVQVGHLRDARPERLSAGEAQRVAIARALAMEPEVLCLDEITSALDPEQVAGILDLVRHLSAVEKTTMIMVSHHIGFAREVAGHVVFVDRGKIVENGPSSTILSAPRTKQFQSFMGAVLAGG